MARPLVIVPSCTRILGEMPYQVVQMKYVDAVLSGADCQPLILPAFEDRTDWDALLNVIDGILLSGSPSNVHPSYYGQEVHNPALPQDVARDETTLPLIREAVERGIPLIAVCRGAQEMNVALGGSLHQAVQEVEGKMDHRERGDTAEEQYALAHSLNLTAGGKLAQILGGVQTIQVNSLHGQGIDQLAKGLQIEAVADDGLIEAYSVKNSLGFALAMQWHPEWRLQDNLDSVRIFAAFGKACQAYRDTKS